jgi:hypothetical protein
MPSSKPLIALRLPQPMYDQVRALAEKDGRTVTNFIEQQLKRTLPAPSRQMDITDAIAAAVKRGPVKTSKHK